MLITSGSWRVNLWYCKTKLDTSHSKGLKGQENGTVNHFSYLTGKMNTFIEKKLATWIKLSQLQGSELWMQDTLPGLSSFQHERSTELQPKIKTWPTYQCTQTHIVETLSLYFKNDEKKGRESFSETVSSFLVKFKRYCIFALYADYFKFLGLSPVDSTWTF